MRRTLMLMLVVALLVLTAVPAGAHNKRVSKDCNGWAVSLTSYNTSHDNSVVIEVDGVEVANVADFGRNYSKSGSWADYEDHVLRVEVHAWDDPSGSRGWTFTKVLSQTACNPTTTTTTVPPTTTTTSSTTTTSTTTTTTLPPTTTTTEPPTTTTTEPPTTTTTEPPTTTTTEPPTTTTTEPPTTTTSEPPATTTTLPSTTTTEDSTTTTTEPSSTTTEGTTPPDSSTITKAPELPNTGADTLGLLIAAVALLGAGVFLVTGTKRKEG